MPKPRPITQICKRTFDQFRANSGNGLPTVNARINPKARASGGEPKNADAIAAITNRTWGVSFNRQNSSSRRNSESDRLLRVVAFIPGLLRTRQPPDYSSKNAPVMIEHQSVGSCGICIGGQ